MCDKKFHVVLCTTPWRRHCAPASAGNNGVANYLSIRGKWSEVLKMSASGANASSRTFSPFIDGFINETPPQPTRLDQSLLQVTDIASRTTVKLQRLTRAQQLLR